MKMATEFRVMARHLEREATKRDFNMCRFNPQGAVPNLVPA
jgi:hypothetical protein